MPQENKFNLSIVIPVFNEEQYLIKLFLDLKKYFNQEDIEVIVVNDGSNDDSYNLLEKLKQNSYKFKYKLINLNKNFGKGYAVNKGAKISLGKYILFQDADLEYDPKEFPLLLEPIIRNKADVVFGSRFQSGRPHRVVYFWHRVGNGVLTLLSNFFTDLNLSDMETCYKAFRTEVIKNIEIKENRFGFEPEITAKISKMNLRIYEVGISYYGRTYEEGKKIGWKDGIRAIYCILKYNLF